MKKHLITIAFILLFVTVISSIPMQTFATAEVGELSVDCRGAILIEAETGKVLFEQNADESLPPASVTKVMTLLLVMEAIDEGKLSYGDMLTCSANAASMGGSQVYLEEGEQMSVEELIKCVVISSANDAAVVLAEAVAGSEDAFVDKMNKRAAELGMSGAHFENTNGLDDTATNHVLSARDIAIISRELIRHEKILEFSSTWMDSIRNGSFGLTNTNRLIRFYPGATGLKTGSTSKAKFCMSATAKRDGMHLICVIMGAETRDTRNAAATKLLDWGFANYALYVDEETTVGNVPVSGGISDTVSVRSGRFCAVIPKGSAGKVEKKMTLKESVPAPISPGDVVGEVNYLCGGENIGKVDVFAECGVAKIGFGEVLVRIISAFLI